MKSGSNTRQVRILEQRCIIIKLKKPCTHNINLILKQKLQIVVYAEQQVKFNNTQIARWGSVVFKARTSIHPTKILSIRVKSLSSLLQK